MSVCEPLKKNVPAAKKKSEHVSILRGLLCALMQRFLLQKINAMMV